MPAWASGCGKKLRKAREWKQSVRLWKLMYTNWTAKTSETVKEKRSDSCAENKLRYTLLGRIDELRRVYNNKYGV